MNSISNDPAMSGQGAAARGAVDVDEIAHTHWDAIIVGTGMGGGTMGYALARAGWKVLFCE